MGKTRNVKAGILFRASAHLALASMLMGLWPAQAYSDLVTEGGGGQGEGGSSLDVTPTIDPTLPVDFNKAGIANQGNIFNDCSGQVLAQIKHGIETIGGLFGAGKNSSALASKYSIDTGIGAAGLSLDNPCAGSDIAPSADSLSCETLAPANGVPSKAVIEAKAAQIGAALRTVQCKKLKLEAAQGELACLTSEAQKLTEQVASIQGAYQDNIQRMQGDVSKIQTVIDDRFSQNQDVLERLGGSNGSKDRDGNEYPGNGSKGLLGIRDGLCAALGGGECGNIGTSGAGGNAENSIPGQIRKLSGLKRKVETGQKILLEAINDRTMGIASDCLTKNVVPSFHCGKGLNAPSVTPLEYISCRYEQKLGGKDSRGQVDQHALESKGVKAVNATTRAGELRTLLSGMLSRTPQETPQDANGNVDVSKIKAPTLLTAEDIEKDYAAKLKQFDDMPVEPGEDSVHSFVKKAVGVCFAEGQKIVKAEKGLASSPIGSKQIELDDAKEEFDTQAETALASNASRYEEAMTALTGGSFAIDTAKCNTSAGPGENEVAARQRKIDCVSNLKNNMTGLLKGTLKNSTIKMSLIGGSDPKTNLFFECQGLNGCIAALQSVDRNLKKEIKRVSDFKRSYVQKAKQSVDNFTKSMAGIMNKQSGALNARLLKLNKAFTTLGISPINIPKVPCEKPAFDQDGLPEAPQNAVNLIGCQMNPQMIDVSGGDFATSLSTVASGSEALNEKLAPIHAAFERLELLSVECRAAAVKRKLAALLSEANQLASGNCEFHEQFCTEDAGPLEGLASTLNEIEGVGMDQELVNDIGASLSAGVGGCNAGQRILIEERELRRRKQERNDTLARIQDCERREKPNRDAAIAKDGAAASKFVSHCESTPAELSDTSPSGGVSRVPAANCRGIARNIASKITHLQSAAGGDSSAGGAR